MFCFIYVTFHIVCGWIPSKCHRTKMLKTPRSIGIYKTGVHRLQNDVIRIIPQEIRNRRNKQCAFNIKKKDTACLIIRMTGPCFVLRLSIYLVCDHAYPVQVERDLLLSVVSVVEGRRLGRAHGGGPGQRGAVRGPDVVHAPIAETPQRRRFVSRHQVPVHPK